MGSGHHSTVRIDRLALEEFGGTQEALHEARRLGQLPIKDARTIDRVFNGEPVSYDTALKIAEWLEVPAKKILLAEALQIDRSLGRIEDAMRRVEGTTALRRHLAHAILLRTAENLKVLGDQQLFRWSESQFSREMREYFPAQPTRPGLRVWALCGKKSYDRPAVKDYFESQMKFAGALAQLASRMPQSLDQIRIERIFVERGECSEDERAVRMQHCNNSIGVRGYVIPIDKQHRVDDIEAGLRKRIVDDGLGFLLFLDPLGTPPDFGRKAIVHVMPEGATKMDVAVFDKASYVFDELLRLWSDLRDFAQPLTAELVAS